MIPAKVRSPRWEREELILALDLYFEVNPYQTSDQDPKVINLSNLLKKLNIPTADNVENFRNPNSVYMKMCNFLAHDPSYKGSGLLNGGKLDKVVWDEFSSDRELLRKTSIDILNSRGLKETTKSFNLIDHEKNKKIMQNVIKNLKNNEK